MKCPLQNDMTGDIPECSPGCAWLMEHVDNGDRACALAVIAENAGDEFNRYVIVNEAVDG